MSLLKEIHEIKSTKKELREFAYVVGGILILIGGMRWWHHKNISLELVVIGAVLATIGTFLPFLLKPLQKVWMLIALLMGWVMTRVILTILFYLVLTPISLLAKATGKRFLDLRFKDPHAVSYWINKNTQAKSGELYEKQC